MTTLASFVATATFPIRVPSPRTVEAPVSDTVEASHTLASGCDPHRAARPFFFRLNGIPIRPSPDDQGAALVFPRRISRLWFDLSDFLRLGERRPHVVRSFPARSLYPCQDSPAKRAYRDHRTSVPSVADPYSARNGGHDQPRPAYKSANS